MYPTPDPAAYDLLRADAAQTDRSDRLRLVFTGPQAAASLTGLVTSDVLALQPGHGQFAAALTPKGKVIADCRIFHRTDGTFLVDVPAAAAGGLQAMLRKYVNPRLAKVEDVSATLACIGVFGPHARQVVAHALDCTPAAFDLLPALAHTTVAWSRAPQEATSVLVVRSPDFGVDGFECFVAASATAALQTQLTAAGASSAAADALEVLRIEAGRPAWGLDMNDETLAQEARLDALDAISFTKGCYTGQEVVARIHFRGHVNRVLRGIRATAVPEGEVRVFAGDVEIGEVRSRGLSPRLGAIALAMLRREIEPGTPVTLRGASSSADGTVAALPFSA